MALLKTLVLCSCFPAFENGFFFQNGGNRVMGEDEAARVIQAGFKNLKRRNTGSSIVTVVPNGNGTTAGEGELVDHVHDLTIRFIKTQVPGSLSLKGFQDIVRYVQNQAKQFSGSQ